MRPVPHPPGAETEHHEVWRAEAYVGGLTERLELPRGIALVAKIDPQAADPPSGREHGVLHATGVRRVGIEARGGLWPVRAVPMLS